MKVNAEVIPAHTDVAIVGGGMAGLSLALLLATRLPDLEILVMEAHPFPGNGEAALRQPSFDARATALSQSSREIYEGIGLWRDLAPFAATIEQIHVSDRGHPGATRLHAGEHRLPGLGYVIENRALGQVLHGRLGARPRIRVAAPVRVEHTVPAAGGMELAVGGRRCRANLAIVADGADSRTVRQLGIASRRRDYGRMGLIANIALAEPHGGVAFERFSDTGPMALLPLPDAGGEHRAALVWTLLPDDAERLRVAPEADFLDALQDAFGFRAGCFRRAGERVAYPLQLTVAEEQVRRHLAVVGNAAHALHPVAGQGFNLGLRDLARLAEGIAAGRGQGLAPGDPRVLDAYARDQAGDQASTILFSDALPRLFGRRNAVQVAGRNLGLIVLDLVPGLRREFGRFGAGLMARGVKSR